MFEFGKGKRPTEDQDMPQRETTAATRGETQPAAAAPARPAASGSGHAAVIGPSIRIEGDLKGEEDLIIEGEVHGTVNLRSNALTIGGKGQVKADVYAHTIRVEGTMEGDLYAAERAVITKSADVRGNITSPRVSLEDGARFRGSIEMDPESLQPVFGSQRGSGSSEKQAPAPVRTGGASASGGAGGAGSASATGTGKDTATG